jgi:hypothetical protein
VVVIVQSDYGFVSATVATGATCTARAVLPNNQQVLGLEGTRVAGSSGIVSWTYPQGDTKTGEGRHFVSCSLGRLSDSDSAPFQVGS